MSWMRVVLGGLAAGLVTNIVDSVLHGMVLGRTYQRFTEAFTATPAPPYRYTAIALGIGLASALLFARTRRAWPAGWRGGALFGLYLGFAGFFVPFYQPLVIDGFPGFLAWCWGGIHLIGAVAAGAALGAIVRAD